MKSAVRFAASAFLFSAPIFAAVIDVTNLPAAYVHPGAGVAIEFGIRSYSFVNCGESPYPAEIRFSLLGPEQPAWATVNGSSAQYAPGFLFQGWLESLDGSYSAPLVDPDALRMGLPTGMLLVSPGAAVVGGTPMAVSVIDGFVFLEPGFSEALLGSARIRLVNRGEGFTIGLGEELPVRNAVSTTSLGAGGSFTAGGAPGAVQVMNPEPASWLLMASAAILLLLGHLKRYMKTY